MCSCTACGCARQQRKTVPCLFNLKAFSQVSNTKYWLDSVNHSYYSCLFSTASPRDSHPLHQDRQQLQDEPFPSAVASAPSVSYCFLQKATTEGTRQCRTTLIAPGDREMQGDRRRNADTGAITCKETTPTHCDCHITIRSADLRP